MKKLSVIIPCFNEAGSIKTVIQRVIDAPACGLSKEIIVVDDGSTDGTAAILKELNNSSVKVILKEKNQGKGAAINTAIAAVTGDVAIVQDADFEYDPEEYPKLLKPIIDGDADVVYGSRFISDSAHRVLYFWHSVGNRLLTLVSNMFTDLNLTDMETGFKVFKSEVIKSISIRENRFGIEPEITAKIAKGHKWRIYEVGVSYKGRTYLEGKKIGWRDGFRAFYCILRYNLFD
ncbi:MAG: glycosyltransferase family 2 protein [Fibrobacteres bacterium]|nr:glycosyltransferase family 2 protein [Fibrobacterota bacterium]